MSLLELRGITRTFRVGGEEVRALAGVDLSVAAGEYVAVMGSSGSGKSTLMNVLGCLDRPTAGTYELDGQRVDAMTGVQLAGLRNARLGFVFQAFELMPRTVAWRNVALPLMYARGRRGDAKARALAALEAVGLADRSTHRPSQLSGGQKQRVAIARALVNDPKILMADEPTGNLDSRTTGEILALFRDLHARGHTIVMVTHETDVAANAERVVRMADGKVASDLPVGEDEGTKALGTPEKRGGVNPVTSPSGGDGGGPSGASTPESSDLPRASSRRHAPPVQEPQMGTDEHG